MINFKKKNIRNIIIFLLTIAALFLALKGINAKEVSDAFKQLELKWIIIACLLNSLVVIVKAVRLWTLLKTSTGKGKVKDIIAILFSAYFYNIVFPARGGDVLGIYLFSKWENVSMAQGVGVLIADRIADGIALFFIIIPIFYAAIPQPNITRPFGIMLLIIVISYILSKYLEKRKGRTGKFGTGLSVLWKRKSFAPAIFASFLSWGFQILMLIILGLPLEIKKPWWWPIWFLAAVNISILILPSPGNVGSLEAGGTYALVGLGYPKHAALTFTVIYHIVLLIPILLIGGLISLLLVIKPQPLEENL